MGRQHKPDGTILSVESARGLEKLFIFVVYYAASTFVVCEVLSQLNQLTRLALIITQLLLLSSIIFLKIDFYLIFRGISREIPSWVKLFLGVQLFIGVLTAPNNWDSMTYHLPRVEHWLRNKSFTFYDTFVQRQNWEPPFGDIESMIPRSIFNTDRFDFIASWISICGIYLLFAFIFHHTAMEKKHRIIAYSLLIIPSMATQISTTQTDLRATLFVILIYAAIFTKRTVLVTLTPLLVGLAFSTKPSSLFALIALPLIIDWHWIRSSFLTFRTTISVLLSGIGGILINLPWVLSNVSHYGSLGGPGNALIQMSLKPSYVTTQIFRAFYCNIVTYPFSFINRGVANVTHWLLSTLFSTSILNATPFGGSVSSVYPIADEDDATNLSWLIVFTIALAILLHRKEWKKALTVGIGYLFSILLVAWQPWINRLLVPTFTATTLIICMILLPIVNRKIIKIISALALIGVVYTSFFVISSVRRPLDGITFGGIERSHQYFNARPGIEKSYSDVKTIIAKQGIRVAGVVGGEDSWEYPLFTMNPNIELRPNDTQGKYLICLEGCPSNLLENHSVLAGSSNQLQLIERNG